MSKTELIRVSRRAKAVISSISRETGKPCHEVLDEYLNLRFVPVKNGSKR